MCQALETPTAAPAIEYSSPQFRRYASYIFWLLWGANFINYVDRFALSAVLNQIQKDFNIDDTQAGLLATSFLFIYTISILPLGLLADRIKRKFVVAGGMAVWSVTTALTGLVTNFPALFATRATLGLGEGSYFPASTAMIAACYPTKDRAKKMSQWNTALLVGAAVGVLGGSYLFDAFGGHAGSWRPVFFIFGVPGLVLALLIFLVREPPRGAEGEIEVAETTLARQGVAGIWRDLKQLMTIRSLRIVVALQALSFFVYGPTALFLPKLVHNQFDSPSFPVSVSLAGTITSAVLFIGGLTGILVGGTLADRLIARFPGARVLVSGWSLLLSAPLLALSVLSMIVDFGLSPQIRLFAIFTPLAIITLFLLQINSGPLTAVSQDVVTPSKRAAAVGLTLLLSHFLGDLFSPTIVGFLSDTLKANKGILSSFNLAPSESLTLAVAILVTCVPLLLIAGIVGIRGQHVVKGDMDTVLKS